MGDPLGRPAEELLIAWAGRVRANRAQVERLREAEDGADFYGPVSDLFHADPHRTTDGTLDLLQSLVIPGETWLDIGAGGGRYALPLALHAEEVIAVEPSTGMREVLRRAMAEYHIGNVRILPARWPVESPVMADAALIAHVGYDIEDLGPFIDAMERSARRLCVAVLLARAPSSTLDMLWPDVHGEERSPLPALLEFIQVLLARGRLFELRLAGRAPQSYSSVEQALTLARRQTWVAPASEKDHRLAQAVAAHLVERDGRYAFRWEPSPVGVVTWDPHQS